MRVRTFQTAMTAVKSGTKKGHERVCCETNSQGHHRHFLPCRSQAAWSSGKLEPQADPVGRLRWVQLFPLEMQNVAKCCKIQQNPMIHHHVLLLLAQKIMQVWPAPTVPAPWSKDHALSAALCYCNRLSKKVAFPLEISREHEKVCNLPIPQVRLQEHVQYLKKNINIQYVHLHFIHVHLVLIPPEQKTCQKK